MGIFSSRAIEKGEELSYNYNFESFGPPQTCRCGAAKCIGSIGSSKPDGAGEYKTTKSMKNPSIMKTIKKTTKKHLVVPYIANKHNVFLARNLKPSSSKRDTLGDISTKLTHILNTARSNRIFLSRNLRYGSTPTELRVF